MKPPIVELHSIVIEKATDAVRFKVKTNMPEVARYIENSIGVNKSKVYYYLDAMQWRRLCGWMKDGQFAN